jgi:hypothetical protein
MVDASEYIKFVDVPQIKSRRTRVEDVVSVRHGYVLGTIRWYGFWRQYVFVPATDTVFNVGCLRAIIDHVLEMTAAHKRMLAERKAQP